MKLHIVQTSSVSYFVVLSPAFNLHLTRLHVSGRAWLAATCWPDRGLIIIWRSNPRSELYSTKSTSSPHVVSSGGRRGLSLPAGGAKKTFSQIHNTSRVWTMKQLDTTVIFIPREVHVLMLLFSNTSKTQSRIVHMRVMTPFSVSRCVIVQNLPSDVEVIYPTWSQSAVGWLTPTPVHLGPWAILPTGGKDYL